MVSISGTYQFESQENIEAIWEAMGKYSVLLFDNFSVMTTLTMAKKLDIVNE